MTDRELKKLSRIQLLEMLLAQSRELEQLKEELEQAQAELNSRRIKLQESGSIAEAALKLNGVFEAAQSAADQYIQNVTERSRTAEDRCRTMEEQTRKKCDKMVKEAQAEAARFWDEVREKLQDPLLDEASWQKILKSLDEKPGKGHKVK